MCGDEGVEVKSNDDEDNTLSNVSNVLDESDQSECDCDCRFPHYDKAFVCNDVSCSNRHKSSTTHADKILKCYVCVTSPETKSANRKKFVNPVTEAKYNSASRWAKLSKCQKVKAVRKHRPNNRKWSRFSIIQRLMNVESEGAKILHRRSYLEKHRLVN